MREPILLRDPKLRLVVERLVQAYQPERIYLFGSIARGDADSDSDYDLMVIAPDGAPPEHRGSRLAYQALRGAGTAADVVVWTRSSFERRTRVAASLPATVLREGRLVYAVWSGADRRDAGLACPGSARSGRRGSRRRMSPWVGDVGTLL